MILKFRMLSDEVDDFVRDYEIEDTADMLELHDLICSDLEYDLANFCSFFTANAKWNKLQEYTLADMQDDDEGVVALPMAGTLIRDVLAQGVSRLIFVFDLLSARALYLEVADCHPQEDSAAYPRVSYSAGDPPSQSDAESLMTEADPFHDMMEEFSDFEGSEEEEFGDDF